YAKVPIQARHIGTTTGSCLFLFTGMEPKSQQFTYQSEIQTAPLPTFPWRTKYSTAPATVSAWAAVLLRNSVVIDVHSERNRTNRLTVSFRSPRQLLPGVLLRFRCYNIYLDRIGIMRSYGINHRTWFLGPARGQDRTQGDLFRRVGIVMN